MYHYKLVIHFVAGWFSAPSAGKMNEERVSR